MFENVQFFSHLHFEIAKSAIMTQKISWKISLWVSKTRRILCWCWCRLKQMSIKKLEPKNYANFKFFCFCAFFRGFFFLLTFVRGISETKLFSLHFPFQIKFATPFVTHYYPSKKPATVTQQLQKSIDFHRNELYDFHPPLKEIRLWVTED
jgi:hypothetical protein